MMRRDIKKSFWVNSEEDRDIKAKSQAAGLTEAEFLRQRVKGYHPVGILCGNIKMMECNKCN